MSANPESYHARPDEPRDSVADLSLQAAQGWQLLQRYLDAHAQPAGQGNAALHTLQARAGELNQPAFAPTGQTGDGGDWLDARLAGLRASVAADTHAAVSRSVSAVGARIDRLTQAIDSAAEARSGEAAQQRA